MQVSRRSRALEERTLQLEREISAFEQRHRRAQPFKPTVHAERFSTTKYAACNYAATPCYAVCHALAVAMSAQCRIDGSPAG